jgi:diguanylate cyclase (GGDEF)-like protein/PAS domain S-box-containing protein
MSAEQAMENKRIWTNNELDDLLRQLNVALEASGIGIWQHNLRKNQTRWDEQLQELYGVPKGPTDVVWLECVHPDDRDAANAHFEKAIENREDYASQFRIIRQDGSIRHLRSRAKFFIDGNGEPCFVGAEWDVTDDVMRSHQLAEEREAADQSRAEARYAADHDHLTGLLNRRSFDAICASLAKRGELDFVSLCHLDVDNFKEINDRYGHACGDVVIAHVASILKQASRPGDIVARLGGDEFAIVSMDRGLNAMEKIVAEIRAELQSPVLLNGKNVVVTCSMGVAQTSASDVTGLLACSDLALYEAKRNGRNRAEWFSPAMAAASIAEKHILYELRSAITNGNFVPFYQVQVDARTRAIKGLEALVRWKHGEELKPPGAFLPTAVTNGLIDEIDEIMLRLVLADLRRWQAEGFALPRVSVNMSASRLSDPDLEEKLKRLDIPAGQVSFELVETIFLDELTPEIRANIDAIRSLGIEIEIDDLGSGHASLLGLIKLRPDRVKIDRQLILPMLDGLPQQRLVAALVDIARTLDMEVVAEGVETLGHADVLASLGVDLLQGFALGRPEPAHVVEKRLEKRHTTAPTGSRASSARRR